MKKIVVIILLLAIVLSVAYFVGTGFMTNDSVYIGEYSVSEDGTEMRVNASVATSMGHIRGYEDKGGGVKPHYLKFYSCFGGLNSDYGAEKEFVLPLDEDDTEIYIYRGNGGYELVLKRNEETDIWEKVQRSAQ